MDWIRMGTAGMAAVLLGAIAPPLSSPPAEAQVAEARAPQAEPERRSQTDRADWLSVLGRLRSQDLREQKQALASLRRLHRHLLRRVTRDSALDEDALFSDFLLKLEQSYQRHVDPDRPEATIRSVYALAHRIVRSTLADAAGRVSARGEIPASIDELGEHEPAGPAPDDHDVARAIDRLPEEQRSALQATLESGSVRAAAKALGLRAPQVRYRVDAARSAISDSATSI